MSTLRDMLVEHLGSPASNGAEASPVESQAAGTVEGQPANPASNGGTGESTLPESIPYNRFQEVVHDNQRLRAEQERYQQQLQQVQARQQQPQTHGLTGMERTAADPLNSQQQKLTENLTRQITSDPQLQKEWQDKIQKGGVPALTEFISQFVTEAGNSIYEQTLAPLVAKINSLERGRVEGILTQYRSQVADPEFPAYGHLFDDAVRRFSTQYDFSNPNALELVRSWAKLAYQSQNQGVPYGGGIPQGQQPYQPTPYAPMTERPGAARPAQPQQDGRYGNFDKAMAERFGLDPAKLQQTRATARRGGSF